MRVHVDDPRRDDVAGGVEGFTLFAANRANFHESSVSNRYVAGERRLPRPIDDARVLDDQVMHKV